jgi:GxxExxY protein
MYDEITLNVGYRIDMIVGEAIVIENKAVLDLHPVHQAQLLTYLKLTDLRLGFLINWNVPLIKNGIKRIANGF